MKYNEFIGRVQNTAGLPSEDKAVTVTRATLGTLASRLTGEEPGHLASQLPQEIGTFLTASESIREKGDFPLIEFYQRVADLTDSKPADARHYAHSVMTVLRSAVPDGELNDIKAKLPDEYDVLLNPPGTEKLHRGTKGEG